jgi:hypothetical protein
VQSAAILKEMRRRLGEVLVTLGEALPIYSDDFLLDYVAGAALHMNVMGFGDASYSVNLVDNTITPEPSDMDGILLSAMAVMDLVNGDTLKKVIEGELGVRFKTGMEELSTTEASKEIRKAAQDLKMWFMRLKTHKLSKTNDNGSFRVQ